MQKRLPHIGVARLEIEEGSATSTDAAAFSRQVHVRKTPAWVWALAFAFVLVLGAAAGYLLRPTPSVTPEAPTRLSVSLGGDVSLDTYIGQPPGTSLTLAPDGRVLAFVGRKNGVFGQIYVRRLGELEAIPLAGTDGARDPFFSPDGQWIGFFADGKVKKVSVTGGAAVILTDNSLNNDRGASWGDNGTIVFTPSGANGVSLQSVRDTGGKAEQLLKLNQGETTQRWPQVLPGQSGPVYREQYDRLDE